MAQAFRLKRACKALGPSTPFGTHSALRLRSFRRLPSTALRASRVNTASAASVPQAHPAHTNRVPQPHPGCTRRGEHPATPSGMHKPHCTIHVTAKERERLRVLRIFFSLEKRAFEKIGAAGSVRREGPIRSLSDYLTRVSAGRISQDIPAASAGASDRRT